MTRAFSFSVDGERERGREGEMRRGGDGEKSANPQGDEFLSFQSFLRFPFYPSPSPSLPIICQIEK
jgi:hypothetical protein